MTLAPGSTFGPYQILSPLGRGGMATVYKAYEPALDRPVALKVLPREFIHDPGFATRFEREAKVIARLEHPNIIPIHSFGIEAASGTPWMAMRFISGGPLSALIKDGRLTPARTVGILKGVAEALDYAHGKGVIHRDVKPQNILLDAEERVYLADFGIAKMVENSPGLTVTGMVTGTPQYMAPEQGMGRKIDSRVDIYALGVVAYEMLTGRVPFSADTPVAVLMKHVTGPIPVPAPEEVPEALTRALLKALAKQADERWPSAGAFLKALEQGLGEAPTAVGMPAVETLVLETDVQSGATDVHATPTLASQAQDVAATVVSQAGDVAPTVVSVAKTSVLPPPLPTPPAPAPAAAVRPPTVSGRTVMLGLLAFVVVLAVVGAAILLWPKPQPALEPLDDALVAEASPSAPWKMAPPPEAATAAPAPDSSETRLPSPTAGPASPAARSPVATPSLPSPTPVASAPAPTVAPTRPPYRDAGKVLAGKDFVEKTLTFVENGTVALDAEVGALRIATARFVAQEDGANVDVRAMFPIGCPEKGEWNTRIDVAWLAEDGKTIEDDTDRDSCSGETVTCTLRARGLSKDEVAAIRGVRIRFEATPD